MTLKLSFNQRYLKEKENKKWIKKNGEPYQCPNEAWGINYFSLEKVVE